MFIVSIIVLILLFVIPWLLPNRFTTIYRKFLTNNWIVTEKADSQEFLISFFSILSFIFSSEGAYFLFNRIGNMPSIPSGILALGIAGLFNLALIIIYSRQVRGKPEAAKRNFSSIFILGLSSVSSFVLTTFGLQSINGNAVPSTDINSIALTFYLVPIILDVFPLLIAYLTPVNKPEKKSFDLVKLCLFIFQFLSFLSTSFGIYTLFRGLSVPAEMILAGSLVVGAVINLVIVAFSLKAEEYARNNPLGSLLKTVTHASFFIMLFVSLVSFYFSVVGYGALVNLSNRNQVYARFNNNEATFDGSIMKEKENQFIREPVNEQKEILMDIKSEVEASSPATVDERRKGFELKLETIQKNYEDINRREEQINQDRRLFGQDPRVEERAQALQDERREEREKEQEILQQIQDLNNTGEVGKMFYRDGDNDTYTQILEFYNTHITPDYSTRDNHNYSMIQLKDNFGQGQVIIAKYRPELEQPKLENESFILDLIKAQKDLTQFNVENDAKFNIPGVGTKLDSFTIIPFVLALIHDLVLPCANVLINGQNKNKRQQERENAKANRQIDREENRYSRSEQRTGDVKKLQELGDKVFGVGGENNPQLVNDLGQYIRSQIAFQLKWYKFYWITTFVLLAVLFYFNRDVIWQNLV